MPGHPRLNKIGRRRTTRGTETSKYPEEEKSTEIARVAASESAEAQTHASVSARALPHGGRGSPVRPSARGRRGQKGTEQRNGMEGPAAAGESPVREAAFPAKGFPE